MGQVRRRQFLLAAGAGSVSIFLPALAQQEKRVRRIGYFTGSTLKTNAPRLDAFRQGMAALGWVDGRDYVIDARAANGVAQARPGLVAQLVASRPDLLLTNADEGVRLFVQRTKTIPIVFTIIQDPLENRVVANLQRPGGNATGLTSLARDLGAKRLQLLKEAFPHVTHVAVLFEAAIASNLSQMQDIEDAGVNLKIQITPIELRKTSDFESGFKRGAALGAQAYLMAQSPLTSNESPTIIKHALRFKVPAMFPVIEHVEAGGLMSYAPSYLDNFRRAAAYVDKIFKGAKPGDLPIEQPTKFELVLNLKTAKAMGIKFPPSFLARADRVIE